MLKVSRRHFIGTLGRCFGMLLAFSMLAEATRFANDQTLQQIYRVLARGGSLGLIWNVEDCAPICSVSSSYVA